MMPNRKKGPAKPLIPQKGKPTKPVRTIRKPGTKTPKKKGY